MVGTSESTQVASDNEGENDHQQGAEQREEREEEKFQTPSDRCSSGGPPGLPKGYQPVFRPDDRGPPIVESENPPRGPFRRHQCPGSQGRVEEQGMAEWIRMRQASWKVCFILRDAPLDGGYNFRLSARQQPASRTWREIDTFNNRKGRKDHKDGDFRSIAGHETPHLTVGLPTSSASSPIHLLCDLCVLCGFLRRLFPGRRTICRTYSKVNSTERSTSGGLLVSAGSGSTSRSGARRCSESIQPRTVSTRAARRAVNSASVGSSFMRS